MSELKFLKGLAYAPVEDLLTRDEGKLVKRVPVAYVLLAARGKVFQYPGGESPVFYIGQGGLLGRLRGHRMAINKAKLGQRVGLALAEYGAMFGARYTYVLASSWEAKVELERELMARFKNQFRCLPVANGRHG